MELRRGDGAARLDVVPAGEVAEVHLRARVRQFAILADRGGRVIERIGARRVGEVVVANEGVRREHGLGPDHPRVARCDVVRLDVLVLRLRQRVVGVRDVESRLADLHVEEDRVGVAWVQIEPVEDRRVVAAVVDRVELGRIEVPIRARAGHRQEIADGVRPGADVDVRRRAAERAVAKSRAAGRLRVIQSGLRHDVHDQAALVAILGRRHARDHFHRLHRLG